MLCLGAVAHDLGKIFVPGGVLHKPGRLTPQEWESVRRHPRAGEQLLLAAMPGTEAARTVCEHHERWDGGGYPAGLRGKGINAGARIVAVADAYDAMTSERAYREAMTHEEAAAELARCSGTQFDPCVVEAFRRVPRSLLEDIIGRRAPAIR
jgi:HD-GYP domain-containing protein (c-di-GMP phosphodiesterase class II)